MVRSLLGLQEIRRVDRNVYRGAIREEQTLTRNDLLSVYQQIRNDIQKSISFTASLLNSTQTNILRTLQQNSSRTQSLLVSLQSGIKRDIFNLQSASSVQLRDLQTSIIGGIKSSQNENAARLTSLEVNIKNQLQQERQLEQRLNQEQTDAINNAGEEIENALLSIVEQLQNVVRQLELSNSEGDPLVTEFENFADAFISLQNIPTAIEETKEAVTANTNFLVERFFSLQEVIEQLDDGEFLTGNELQDALFGDSRVASIGRVIYFFMAFLPLLRTVGDLTYSRFYDNVNRLAVQDARPVIVSENLAAENFRRGFINNDKLEDLLKKQGIRDDDIPLYKQVMPRLLEVTFLQEALRRGDINEDRFLSLIRGLGFATLEGDLLLKQSFYIAPPQDVIRMMVRDVFDEELAELSGIFEGWDNPDYLREAGKAGISPSLARLYWAAHWILPSIGQGYEMFQREVINRNQLETLFRAQDIAPAWRDPLLAISYNLPTRVDVRRAYEDGIISDEQLETYIRHSGVAPDWRQAIFDWHKARRDRVSSPDERIKDLPANIILKLYNFGRIGRDTAIRQLVELGWNANDADLILLAEDLDNEGSSRSQYVQSNRNKLRKLAEDMFRERTISGNEALSMIEQSGISTIEAQTALALIDLQYQLDRKRDVINAYRDLYLGYEVSEGDYRSRLLNAGFTEIEINRHLEEINPLRDIRYRDLTRADIRKAVLGGYQTDNWGINQLRGNRYSDNDIEVIRDIEGWDGQSNNQ